MQSHSSAIEEAIKALEKKILDIGGSRLLAQKSKVDGLKLHINIANEEITKAEVAMAKAEKDSIKFKGTIASNRRSLEDVETELEKLSESLQEVKDYVADIRAKVEAAQAEVENSKDDLENLKTELDEKTEEIQAFRKKEVRVFPRNSVPLSNRPQGGTDPEAQRQEDRTEGQQEHDGQGTSGA